MKSATNQGSQKDFEDIRNVDSGEYWFEYKHGGCPTMLAQEHAKRELSTRGLKLVDDGAGWLVVGQAFESGLVKSV